MIVDTGSSVSLLPAHVNEDSFSHIPLNQTDVPLVTYSRQRIPVLGRLDTHAFHDGCSAPASFYIVESGSLLLWLDLIEALEMVIVGNKVILRAEQAVRGLTVPSPTTAPHPPITTALPPPPSATTPPATPPAPPATITPPPPATTAQPPPMGCVKNFVHKVKVRDDVKTVQQKLRRLPFVVRYAVSAELKRLLDVDIIEKTDASPWVSPIAVTQWKNSARIRMLPDLRPSLPHSTHGGALFRTQRSNHVLNHRPCKCLPSGSSALPMKGSSGTSECAMG